MAAFREPAKLDYTNLWTREPLPEAMFADLLSVHPAYDRRAHSVAKQEILPALADATEQRPGLVRPGGKLDPAGTLVWLREFRPILVPSIFNPAMPARGLATLSLTATARMEMAPIDQKTVVTVMRGRHPEVGDKDELFRRYVKERAQSPCPLPPHQEIKRSAFRDLIDEIRRSR